MLFSELIIYKPDSEEQVVLNHPSLRQQVAALFQSLEHHPWSLL